MDRIDRKILHELRRNAKVTHAELADRVGLSISSCQRRVKGLEERGVITGYQAVINPEALSEGLVIIVGLTLESHTREALHEFQKALAEAPEVKEIYHLAGQFDFFAKVAVKDINAYEDFHLDTLATIPGLERIHSFMVMSTLKGP
ncbi:Lrp/AsnC family transcriptional regulator [Desulfoluna spongiiphila]|uniref:Lrp/AsnC family transcriptional regulator, leucine-responsive regulatory protein n=1 Tax=Desulfoluna spongiiphila TaxID=419481 RepID=A0A1G5ADS3_9BACT|nr:Lrp/AsnC family transcriptional regulator [Desulfoluna spongiiphila]SCX76042.1 Lrp/AsnC family transcriptional regulator, leucine-responsive regulatory protein [Desulfoluna spongiiphila]